jgi:hypothetical protein
MAATPSPMGNIAAQDVVRRLAAASGPSGGATQTPGAAGDNVSRQLAELSGADPKILLKMTQQIKQMTVALLTRTAFVIPGASRQFAQVQKYIDNAIKEMEQAAAAQQNVSQQEGQGPPKIANRAGMGITPPEGGGGMPEGGI